MNREDIIRLAREAGLTGLEQGGILENFQRFAALVAAAEREACKKLLVALRDSDEEEMGYRSLVLAVEAIEARGEKA